MSESDDTRRLAFAEIEQCIADWSYDSEVAKNVISVLVNLGLSIDRALGRDATEWAERQLEAVDAAMAAEGER